MKNLINEELTLEDKTLGLTPQEYQEIIDSLVAENNALVEKIHELTIQLQADQILEVEANDELINEYVRTISLENKHPVSNTVYAQVSINGIRKLLPSSISYDDLISYLGYPSESNPSITWVRKNTFGKMVTAETMMKLETGDDINCYVTGNA